MTDAVKSALRGELEQSAAGLLYISETDAPFEYVELSPAPAELSPEAVREALGEPAGTPVSTQTLDTFFTPMIERADPADPVMQANVEPFRKLKQKLRDELDGTTVFRVGEVELRCYLLGRTRDGRVAGLVTRAVET